MTLAAAVGAGNLSAANADSDALPVGKIGVVAGLRQGAGPLGDAFDVGYLMGVDASFQPTTVDRLWTFGAAWSVLWGWFEPSNPSISTGTLRIVELNGGLRVRRQMGEAVPRFLVATSGATLLRSNIPMPDERKRHYLGPHAGLGLEQYWESALLGRSLISFEGRYGLLVGGPGALSLLVSFAFGLK